MVINGFKCTDKKDIANSFNPFFVSIGEQNNANVERQKSRISVIILPIKLTLSLHFAQLGRVILCGMIRNVKLSNSKEHDGISSDLLKLIGNAISKSINLIINQSLTTGILSRVIGLLQKLKYVCRRNERDLP